VLGPTQRRLIIVNYLFYMYANPSPLDVNSGNGNGNNPAKFRPLTVDSGAPSTPSSSVFTALIPPTIAVFSEAAAALPAVSGADASDCRAVNAACVGLASANPVTDWPNKLNCGIPLAVGDVAKTIFIHLFF